MVIGGYYSLYKIIAYMEYFATDSFKQISA